MPAVDTAHRRHSAVRPAFQNRAVLDQALCSVFLSAEHADGVQPLLHQRGPATDGQLGGAQAEGVTALRIRQPVSHSQSAGADSQVAVA
jgi:hypothetical protein